MGELLSWNPFVTIRSAFRKKNSVGIGPEMTVIFQIYCECRKNANIEKESRYHWKRNEASACKLCAAHAESESFFESYSCSFLHVVITGSVSWSKCGKERFRLPTSIYYVLRVDLRRSSMT